MFYDPTSSHRLDDLEEQVFKIKTVSMGRQTKNFSMVDGAPMFTQLETETVVGYLANVKPLSVSQEGSQYTSLLCFFVNEAGEWFKSQIQYDPYFYVEAAPGFLDEAFGWVSFISDKKAKNIERIRKTDLGDPNHLRGSQTEFIKISFHEIKALVCVRKQILDEVAKNRGQKPNYESPSTCVVGLREHDVNYHSRVLIDKDIRVATWYKIDYKSGFISKMEKIKELTYRPEFTIVAFDLETYKSPYRFPDAEIDPIMMISYVIDGQGHVITNRQVVGDPGIENSECAIDTDYKTEYTITQEPDEKAMICTFLNRMKQQPPFIMVTYNGDNFDWPYLVKRASKHELDLKYALSVEERGEKEYYGRFVVHMDCFPWVERDSYLPQGSHGLKAVTKAKLGYAPLELDPEEMVRLAHEKPALLCEYAMSDSVATYNLYLRHIHDFIFSLCNVIPLPADDVLRRGSGTLCEHLLMAEAYGRSIIFANKTPVDEEKFYKGHLLESETYIGAKVECLHNGVYRDDLPTDFNLSIPSLQSLHANVDEIMKFHVEQELNKKLEDLTNLSSVKSTIKSMLANLLEAADASPNSGAELNRTEADWFAKSVILNKQPRGSLERKPLIYHIDIAAMYPNIILTNRLQPVSIVTPQRCSGCIYNSKGNDCKRELGWKWKGDFYPLNRGEYERLKLQFEAAEEEANTQEEASKFKKAVKQYCQKHYKNIYTHETELRKGVVCMRENPFYVDAVRAFRDRRYELKSRVKASLRLAENLADSDPDESKKEAQQAHICESMQVALKCILNSFYGYVMRRGARWHSMEMAAMVTHTGSLIIEKVRDLLTLIGKPLELDTDGVWTLLPSGFPEAFELHWKDGSATTFSFPCSVCNLLIYEEFKNPQFQRETAAFTFTKSAEMSIFFEIDGPYRAMVIPAAREENKLLKKRYAVFDKDGSTREIKGFEVKRRGELKLIQIFQTEIFGQYLRGSTLAECYAACSSKAEAWLSVLRQKGKGLSEVEILGLLTETKTLSKSVDEYDAKKGVAITAAKRLGELLGTDILTGSGLSCRFVIVKQPASSPLSDRAVPVSVFTHVDRLKLLKKWLKEPGLKSTAIEELLDWAYYEERLGNTIQKMVTLSAAYQGLANPIPSLAHPKWLEDQLKLRKSVPQPKLSAYFNAKSPMDVEPEYQSVVRPVVRDMDQVPQKPVCITPIDSDFDSWHREHVALWKSMYKQGRKPANFRASSRGMGLTNFIKQGDSIWKTSVWHIVAVIPTSKFGDFSVWVSLPMGFYKTEIRVPRTFLMHSHSTSPSVFGQLGGAVRRVEKTLPRAKKKEHLFEATLPEAAFQARLPFLEKCLLNTEVEGIYETQVSLEFRIIMRLGAVCKPSPSAVRPPDTPWSLSDMIPLKEHSGIQKSTLNLLYLYAVPFLGYRLVVLFSPRKARATLGLFHKGKIEDLGRIKKILASAIARSGSVQQQESVSLEVIQATEERKHLYASVRKMVANAKETLGGQPIVAAFGLQASLPGLFDGEDQPVLTFGKFDFAEFQESTGSLDWHLKAIEVVAEALVQTEPLLDEKFLAAKYLNIPVCSLADHWELLAGDVLFGRILTKNNIVLWANNKGRPDLGGGDVERENLNGWTNGQTVDEQSKLVFSPNFTAELPLEYFELAAVLRHEDLEKSERDLSMLLLGKNGEGYGNQAFKSVHELLLQLLSLQTNHPHPVFASLAGSFLSWASHQKSLFYDPLLSRLISQIVSKLKQKLMHELTSHSVSVVSLSPARLVLDTKKKTLESATEYLNFVRDMLAQSDFFADIGLGEASFWRILLYQSEKKYIGFRHSDTEVECVWKETDALPQFLRQEFYYNTCDFLINFVESFEKLLQSEHLPDELKVENVYKSLKSLIRGYFHEQIIPRVVRFVKDIQARGGEEFIRGKLLGRTHQGVDEEEDDEAYDSEDSFLDRDDEEPVARRKKKSSQYLKNKKLEEFLKPEVPGDLSGDGPSLGLFKVILCEFFSAIPDLSDLSLQLAHTLDGLLGIEPEKQTTHTQTSNVLLAIKLEKVFCSECLFTCDLDLFKSFISDSNLFYCPNCKESYAAAYMETRIIEWLLQNSMQQGVQDLYCSDTKQSRLDALRTHSASGGEYRPHFLHQKLQESFEIEVSLGLKNLRVVANKLNLKNLLSVINQFTLLGKGRSHGVY